MKLKDFYFDLPDERIARQPSDKRDQSRLMLVDRQTGTISHHRFKDLPELIGASDFLVVNNTKVIPARLFGEIDGKKSEMLIVGNTGENNEVEALTRPAKRFKPGEKVIIDGTDDVWAEVLDAGHRGRRTLRFNKPLESVLTAGYAPLPPYIKRKPEEAEKLRTMDLERYQTVYSRKPGSIAAPTAGLHFTPRLMDRIKQTNEVLEVTLQVGEATFQKIEVEDIDHHRMGRETITITEETRQRIRQLKQDRELIAVGTTSVRSLETWAIEKPMDETFVSELFIKPGYSFKMVDKMITNFHLPESSLFILVSAFAGLELMQEAYLQAIKEGYNFFSYGDAMFIK
jgi:S-adenosylmethionine:tRNA ribosyltransferase-isomerase